jgi:AraC family transcriptional regulator
VGLTGVALANLDLLMRSLEFIEEHLEDTVAVQTEDIAAASFASKSALEKVFKYTIHFSVHDYIIRRKMTRAARLMIEKPALSILDIAVQFGYSSHEAFTQ